MINSRILALCVCFIEVFHFSDQNISVTTIKNDVSECYVIQSDPIAASVIEENYLWWPVGVKWPSSPPTLVEANTGVSITENVSIGDH